MSEQPEREPQWVKDIKKKVSDSLEKCLPIAEKLSEEELNYLSSLLERQAKTIREKDAEISRLKGDCHCAESHRLKLHLKEKGAALSVAVKEVEGLRGKKRLTDVEKRFAHKAFAEYWLKEIDGRRRIGRLDSEILKDMADDYANMVNSAFYEVQKELQSRLSNLERVAKAALNYHHAKNKEEAKEAKLKLFEACANYEHAYTNLIEGEK